MKKVKNINPALWLVIGIVVFVGILLLLMLVAQQSFSHRIMQVTFTISAGPVSPEYQQSTQLVLTSSSCEITRTQSQLSETKACPMDSSTFERIQKSTIEYGVIDKIIGSNNSPELIGDRQASVAIELQNGTIFTTRMTPQFYTNLAPYFEEIELLVPSLSQVLPSQ